MAVVKSECGGTNVCYTGVDEDGEQRDCARCMRTVEIDPEKDSVQHVENE